MHSIEGRLAPQLKQWNLIFDGSVSQAENLEFCEKTFNNQTLHISKEAAKAKGFEDILINGILTWKKLDEASQIWLMKILNHQIMGYRILATDKVQHPNPLYPEQRLTGFLKLNQIQSVVGGVRIGMDLYGWSDGNKVAIQVTNSQAELSIG